MKRSKHTLSHYRMVTGNMGELMPISCIPVLPGDTLQHSTSALVRVSPLNTPVMHPVTVRLHHFYCPNRILWDGWEDFITGGPDGTNTDPIPTVETTGGSKSILSYLGCPPIPGIDVNALPLRACNLIYNEYYRDQDLQNKRDDESLNFGMRCSWEKDYFTSARPWSQKGPSVSLPMGGTAPIVSPPGASTGQEVHVGDGDRDADNPYHWDMNSGTPPKLEYGANTVGPGAPLLADLTQAESPDINDWRAAFSIQRYQEARARYGSRFTEYLRYLGINPSDARLQRPEFLGGGSTRLNFSEVLQTAPTDASGGAEPNAVGIGDMFGHGIAGIRSNKYRKFFEEHGYVITMLSVRPKSIYMNGVPRDFLKTTKEDFYQKELTNLGQQEVYQAELYAENDRDVFGYQDRYHEYRSQPSSVSQEFRDTLNAWHLARELEPDVTLNASFVECEPSTRIFQIEEGVDTLWIMANHNIVARRLVPKTARPRIL